MTTEILSSFLSHRHPSDRYRLLDLLKRLYQCCCTLCTEPHETSRYIATPLTDSGNCLGDNIQQRLEDVSEIESADAESSIEVADHVYLREDEPQDDAQEDSLPLVEVEVENADVESSIGVADHDYSHEDEPHDDVHEDSLPIELERRTSASSIEAAFGDLKKNKLSNRVHLNPTTIQE